MPTRLLGKRTVQLFDAAVGNRVAAKERASNPTGAAVTNINTQNGGILGYYNLGSTFAFADPQLGQQLMGTAGQFELAGGDTIGTGSSAYKTSGSRSNAKMEIQNGQVNGYECVAGVDLVGFETRAQQNIFGEADGNVIGFTASSSNAERDISNLMTDIQGTETEPGYISGYSDLTESFQSNAFANIFFDQALGNEIHLSSSSSNRENDRANANMHAIGDGSVDDYGGSSGAAAKTVVASNFVSNVNMGSGISGDEIGYDASTADAARNSASVDTLVLDGLILSPVSNSAMADTSIQELAASQNAFHVSGSLMMINGTATNAAKEKKSLSAHFMNPVIVLYNNFAEVIDGDPTVLFDWI